MLAPQRRNEATCQVLRSRLSHHDGLRMYTNLGLCEQQNLSQKGSFLRQVDS